jgi:hypothetical protein
MNNKTGIDRRALLQQALLLAGAIALPGGADALAAAARSGERLLEPGRFALLTAVADTIVPRTDTPGAVDSEVPQNFDALLRNWAAPARRDALVGALDEIDALALRARQKPFAGLSAAERLELLAPHDLAALKPVPRRDTAPVATVGAVKSAADPSHGRLKQEPVNPLMAEPAEANSPSAKLKELIVVLYYYSEPALTHELSYEHAPGKWQPSIPITPQSRPSGGVGLF